jgi:hypothetical protein
MQDATDQGRRKTIELADRGCSRGFIAGTLGRVVQRLIGDFEEFALWSEW